MNKKVLNEQEIRTQFITPAIQKAGWLPHQIGEETFTAGRVNVQGKRTKRGKRDRADYVLYYKKPHIPIAIVEAKDNHYEVGHGMQQGLAYAAALDIPFVYSSNGDAFLEHDRTGAGTTVERDLTLEQFPTPDELWQRYMGALELDDAAATIFTQDYHYELGGKTARYYQRVAINRTVAAIAQGQQRLLLVMATGTGKTYTAFQIIWRLWKTRQKRRILFLADRNILADQAIQNDFKPFDSQIVHKIQNRAIDKSYEIYFALYQAVSGTEEVQNVYREFSRDFFDMVVVDECHRGSAAADSAWREILDYFSSATQLGLTATPKETKYISNIDYFGQPIYTYSLKQGIADGFLAPYKVIRINLDKDLEGWRPGLGETDKYGHVITDRDFNVRDYDRALILEERTKLVARRVTEYLRQLGNRYAKTIVFCRDIPHASRMRDALAEANADLMAEDSRYVMQMTGDEKEGKLELGSFIDPAERYPVIATTSKLLTTGVDVQTCQLIVLDTFIGSMTEFKQIIGRGTRIREDFGKLYFTVMDFRHATKLFEDPEFDGEPVQIYEPGEDDPIMPPGLEPDDEEPDEEQPDPQQRFYVQDVEVSIVAERVQYYDATGQLITESFKDFSRKNIRQAYQSLDDFLNKWQTADRKEAILAELMAYGILLDKLEEELGKELDPFDLICHVAYDQPPLTRQERANKVQKRDVFAQYGAVARQVLEGILAKYADEGIEAVEQAAADETLSMFLMLDPFKNLGRPLGLIRAFGGKQNYVAAVRELNRQLYLSA